MENLDTYFIISPEALLEKEFDKGNNDLIDQFIEVIPYETVFSKKVVKEKSILVSCFNADFYQLINTIWEKHNCIMKAVVPYYSVGQTEFDLESALLILKRKDSLKNESMISNQEMDEEGLLLQNFQAENKEKSILPIILPIFAILILILIYLIFTSLKPAPQIKPSTETQMPTAIVIPTPTYFPVMTITPAINEFKNSSSSPLPKVIPSL